MSVSLCIENKWFALLSHLSIQILCAFHGPLASWTEITLELLIPSALLPLTKICVRTGFINYEVEILKVPWLTSLLGSLLGSVMAGRCTGRIRWRVMLTFPLIQLRLGYLEKLSPLFDHIALCPPTHTPYTVLVPISVGIESFGGYDARGEGWVMLKILSCGVHSLVDQFWWKFWCSHIHTSPVKKMLSVGLAQWKSSLPLFSLSTAEKSTVTIRKRTSNLESSLCCGATPVSLGCLFMLPFSLIITE